MNSSVIVSVRPGDSFRRLLSFLAFVSVFLASPFLPTAMAQTNMGSANYALRASATVQESPRQITLTWFKDSSNSWDYTPIYTIHRRTLNQTDWAGSTVLVTQGTAGTTGPLILAGDKISFVDSDPNLAAETRYEYRIKMEDAGGPNHPPPHVGYAYVLAGIKIPEVEDRGTALLVVDQTLASHADVAPGLAQLKSDLVGDGWRVDQINVARHDQEQLSQAETVKDLIKAKYLTPGTNLQAVLLIGRVPVPYSGLIAVDGHRPPYVTDNDNHLGAWPADVYYADMTGSWTDTSVDYTNTKSDPAASGRLSNHPGDHKFDQNANPGIANFQIGRIDFANMPVAGNEPALLGAYLARDHNFRHRLGVMDVRRKALISDSSDSSQGGQPHHGYLAPGYRSFSPVMPNGGADIEMAVSQPATADADRWITKVTANTFLFTSAFGAGANDAIAMQGTSVTDPGSQRRVFSGNMVSMDPKAVFYMLMGSWFADWDDTNNLLRAALASDYGLGSMWASRPSITLHQMGLGETIGHSMRLAQNNTGLHTGSQRDPYDDSTWKSVHMALLGDPTLRAHPVRPVANAARATVGSDVQLTWSAPSESAVVGYNIYRASAANGPYEQAPQSFVASPATSYTDVGQAASGYHYMVRTVKLENSGSGTYYNLAQGVFLPPGTSTVVAAPTFTPGAGTYGSAQTVTISSATSGAEIRYTTDGSAPTTTTGTVYSVAVNVSSSQTLRAIAYKTGMTTSSVTNAAYNITSGPPVVTITAPDNSATVGSETDFATWQFTRSTNSGTLVVDLQYSGTAPTWPDYRRVPQGDRPSQVTFPDGVSVVTWEIRAWSNVNNQDPHNAICTISPNAAYTVGSPSSAQLNFYSGNVVASPTYAPGAGTYTTAQTVTISSSTSGAAIRYTTNGSAPTTTTGTVYSGAVSVSSSQTLRAIAYKAGMTDSSVIDATYVISGLPVVTITAPDNSATVGSETDFATWQFTRSTNSGTLVVDLQYSGTAPTWPDYRRVPQGDRPSQVTFPDGVSVVTWQIRAWSNVNNQDPHNAICTLSPNATVYTVGTPGSAQLNFYP